MSLGTTPFVFVTAALLASAGCTVTTTTTTTPAQPEPGSTTDGAPTPATPPPAPFGATPNVPGAVHTTAPAMPGHRTATPAEAGTMRCASAGCSGELCVNVADPNSPRVSPCMYQPKFACYMEATCEQQSDGQCGWTVTPELTACLDSARTTPSPVPAPQVK